MIVQTLVFVFRNVNANPVIKFSFSSPIDTTTTSSSILFFGDGAYIQGNYTYTNNDSTLIVQSPGLLRALTNYSIVISTGLKSQSDSSLKSRATLIFTTAIDSSDKFPQITDSALLTLIEQQTFNYFWSGGNSVSGLARERTSSGNTVTTGGSGFGIMSMLVGVQRNFITRAQALSRVDTIVDFLTNKVTTLSWCFFALDRWFKRRNNSFWQPG